MYEYVKGNLKHDMSLTGTEQNILSSSQLKGTPLKNTQIISIEKQK